MSNVLRGHVILSLADKAGALPTCLNFKPTDW